MLASLTSVPPGLRANENIFVKTSFQNMALQPKSSSPPSLQNASLDSGISIMNRNTNMKNSRMYEDHQDSFYADISSLSSSLMAKDGGNDAVERSLQFPHKLPTNSYESLLHGMESSGSLLNSFSNGLGAPIMGIERPSSLSTFKQPTSGLSILSGSGTGSGSGSNPGSGPGSVSGLGSGSSLGTGLGISGISGIGVLGGGIGRMSGNNLGMGIGQNPELGSMSTEEMEEEVTLLAAQQERAQFPSEFIDKLVAVLKRCGADGLLGSQFPEAFKKLHGEKLVLENKKGI